MLFITSLALACFGASAIAAIPPANFGLPSAPNDTALSVTFRYNQTTVNVTEGELFGVGVTMNEPTLGLNLSQSASLAAYNQSYLILMCDPDARYPQTPNLRFILHWLLPNVTVSNATATNFTGVTPLVNNSQPLVPYANPAPPPDSSAHRYILYAFEQPSNFSLPAAYSGYSAMNRTNFNLTGFIADAELGTPAAAQYFYASNQTEVPQNFTAPAGSSYPGSAGSAIITSGSAMPSTAAAVSAIMST